MLENKVVIITGGTRGIGLETARLFKKNKAEVIILGSKKESVLKAIDSLKKENFDVKGYYPNLEDKNEIDKMLKKIDNEYGHIDILINNAGISANKKIEDTKKEEFEKIMQINLYAIFNMTKAIIPYMKRQNEGVILNTSSMVSIYGQPAGIGYPTSKAALNGFTQSLARELAPFHIRVNAVAPGIIHTDMLTSLKEETIIPLINSIPIGRIGQPQDVANAFLFLASDMASYITGVILPVDGAARF